MLISLSIKYNTPTAPVYPEKLLQSASIIDLSFYSLDCVVIQCSFRSNMFIMNNCFMFVAV